MKNRKTNVWNFAETKLQANSRRLLAIAIAAVVGFSMIGCTEIIDQPENGSIIGTVLFGEADTV
jgi:hypothetical protein